MSIGKLTLPDSIEELFPHQLTINQIDLLPVKVAHLKVLSTLPFHHRDPFDRLIISQAINEQIRLLSVDNLFKKYGVDLIKRS